MMASEIDGACVVIGASRGFGAALTETLGLLQVPVFTVSRSSLDSARSRRGDATDYASMDALAKSLNPVPRHVVYAATSAGGVGHAGDPEVDDARDSMEVNYFGFLNVVKAFLPGLRDAVPASITLVGSRAADSPPDLLAPYGAAKAAAETYARGLARELAGSGVRVNILRIAAETDLVNGHRRAKARLRGFDRERDPLPKSSENTGPAVFLLSTAAEHISGETITAHWRAFA